VKTFIAIVSALLLGIGALIYVYRDKNAGEGGCGRTLTVYCAAGLKKPVEAIAERYKEELGTEVSLQYGGTGTLLGQLQVAKKGDLFIAADDLSVKKALDSGVGQEVIPLVRQYPVIAVAKGNPKGIAGIGDLLREDVKVAVANPEAASIGAATKDALGEGWDALAKKVKVMKPTVTELAADLTVGAVDAAVIWNSTVPQFDGIEAVKAPEFAAQVDTVSAVVLLSAGHPPAALRFARYLAAPEKGGTMFGEKGFDAIEGDNWEERPELVLYSGGVNRPAVEKTLAEFQEREGVQVTTVFNGCGILCASMKAMKDTSAPKFPDAYYACDLCFVPPVAKEFPMCTILTETEIGIAVQKGNPKNIKTLVDLARPGLRLGLCNAEQSTLGYMTDGMLGSSGLRDSIRKNVKVEQPTGDFLITQLQVGKLDAAIVYRVNYQLQEDKLDLIPINHPGARAVQPFSVRVNSSRRQLSGRLLECFKRNSERFTVAGFKWLGDQPPVKSSEIEVPPWLLGSGSR
jgi:molybdate transport system substrate-binding protein